jgi:peptidoglycan/LPS O-acetylase OafA/YrhL
MDSRVRAFDGLRVLSVGAVMLGGYNWLLPFGWIGVLVFYVLSGFLITRILLDERAQAETALHYFGRFYFRRTLRIFPLYFAYLFVLDLVYLKTGVHSTWPQVRPWAFGYAVNIGMFTARSRTPGPRMGTSGRSRSRSSSIWPGRSWSGSCRAPRSCAC